MTSNRSTNKTKEKVYRHKNGMYDEMLMPPISKRVRNWFNKPLKKVGKLYGVNFVTIKPFPKDTL